ncbi:antitoxin Xre/MbcA/ParS toxin-binding domain-containing protein [Alteromonas gracilis]|uniref:Antitoxin Xre/MbcA/ParS-like toxin-binding domain-containing protein n=1 Tax=Alteromonas mediterranea 615 TaxID=1300253 RepID=S5AFC3_9ALTE|nr:hypothetical protein I633_15235 [Alteromonas mediterranea 615]|tara:strand:+ start:366 stop:566 length:201 start_codon:yes stop_codon:yes gene_type:complete
MKLITKDYLLLQLAEFFEGDSSMADEWLHTPLPILGGKQPTDFTDTEERRQKLLDIIGEMHFGEMA